MFSEETEATSSPCGSYPPGAKGLWALGGLTISTVVGHRAGLKPMPRGGSRLWSNQGKMGRMCTST